SDAFRSVRRQLIGPYFFPAIIAGLLALALILSFASGQLNRSEGATTLTRAGTARIALVLAGVLFYVLLAEWLGFVLTASTLLLALLGGFGVRWTVAAAVTVCVVPAVYHLFAVGLRVPLPWGLM